ncbi:Fc.00g028760.m01.CDS01 [Cosmosporella sp. VM-42]
MTPPGAHHVTGATPAHDGPFRRPAAPLRRVPLQDLAVSSTGSLLHTRQRTYRPLPSVAKENMRAIVHALNHQRVTVDQLSFTVTQGIERTLRHPARAADHPRLSMPMPDSDGSSEPDMSVLGMARPGVVPEQNIEDISYGDEDEEEISHQQYEAEETSVEEEEDHEVEEEHEIAPLIDPATIGLKEISNLGKFTVSSHKPENGVEELRSDDLKRFWQSDGPQPHKLTVYFVKRVGIRDIRFYVDYCDDESYTPTKIVFKSGTSENNLIEFASMTLDRPVGWQQVPIVGAGGDPDGNTLVSYVLQMQILENHQNGKDTHLRGIKIYAFDNESAKGAGREHNPIDEIVEKIEDVVDLNAQEGSKRRNGANRNMEGVRYEPGEGGLTIPDFMREPELR